MGRHGINAPLEDQAAQADKRIGLQDTRYSIKSKNIVKEKHPRPENKTSTRQLKKLRILGINNFNEVDIDYWEPRLISETKAEHNARRQRETKRMDEYIAQRKKEVTTHVNKTNQIKLTISESNNKIISADDESENEETEKNKSLLAEQELLEQTSIQNAEKLKSTMKQLRD